MEASSQHARHTQQAKRGARVASQKKKKKLSHNAQHWTKPLLRSPTSAMAAADTRVDLYGGAMTAVLPVRLADVAAARPVPDHQEVFADPQADETLVFEIVVSGWFGVTCSAHVEEGEAKRRTHHFFFFPFSPTGACRHRRRRRGGLLFPRPGRPQRGRRHRCPGINHNSDRQRGAGAAGGRSGGVCGRPRGSRQRAGPRRTAQRRGHPPGRAAVADRGQRPVDQRDDGDSGGCGVAGG